MPPWLKAFINKIVGIDSDAIHYILHSNTPWENWVDSMIHRLWRMTTQAYIINTWSLANFTYFVGSFAATARQWVEWLAYERIPNAIQVANFYTFLRVRQERDYRRAAINNLRAKTNAYIARVALNLANTIQQEVVNRRAAIDNLRTYVNGQILALSIALNNRIDQEIINRRAAIASLRQYVDQQIAKLTALVNTILPTVDKEASKGYNSVRSQQSGILTKALDDLVTDNPEVKAVVGDLVKVVLDLATVDDPLVRVAAQLILTQLVDRLGVDKLAGSLVNDLLSAFLNIGPPKTLEDVEAQTAQRLAAGETQWQQFYANGGDDLEHLGTQMRESANPVFTALLATYFGAAVIDPVGTAADTDAVVTPAATAILGPILATLGAL